MAYKLGLEGKTYRNTGTYGTPVWDEIPNVVDADLSLEAEEADMTNRAMGGFEAILPSIIKATVEAEMLYDPADTDWTTLLAAFLARTLKEYAVADGAIATVGTQYFRAHMYITKFGRSEKLREGMRSPLTLRPGYSSNANPAWVTVS